MTIPELYENLKKEIDKLTYHLDHESCSKCHHCIACEQNNIARAKLSIMKEILQEEVWDFDKLKENIVKNTDNQNLEDIFNEIDKFEIPLIDILKDMNSEGNEK